MYSDMRRNIQHSITELILSYKKIHMQKIIKLFLCKFPHFYLNFVEHHAYSKKILTLNIRFTEIKKYVVQICLTCNYESYEKCSSIFMLRDYKPVLQDTLLLKLQLYLTQSWCQGSLMFMATIF